MRNVLEALSLGLTVPALWFCVLVVGHYSDGMQNILKLHSWRAEPRDWIAAGILIGFIGEFIDGFYWFLTWLAHFYGSPFFGTMAEWGVVINIPSREIMVIMAGYGHVRASMQSSPNFDAALLNQDTILAISAGITLTLFLLVTQGN